MSLFDVLSASYMFFRGKLVLIVSLGMFSSNKHGHGHAQIEVSILLRFLLGFIGC